MPPIRLGRSSSGVSALPLLGTPALLTRPPTLPPSGSTWGTARPAALALVCSQCQGSQGSEGCGGGSRVGCSLSEVLMPPWPPCPEGAWVHADQAGSLLSRTTALELQTGFRGAMWKADPKGQCG